MSNIECRDDGTLDSTQVATSDLDPATPVQDDNERQLAMRWHAVRSQIEGTARRHGASYHDAEDAAQDAYVRILLAQRNGKSPLGTQDDLRRLGNRVVHNLVIDGHRRRQHRPETLVDDYGEFTKILATPAHESPEEVVVEEIGGEIVVEALLAHTTRERRNALRAVRISGYSQTEYAENAGIPRGTALSRVHRGEDDIRNALAGQHPPTIE